MESGENLAQIGAVLGGLFIFGVLYNTFVAELQRKGYDEGYTAILVVFGVAITLIGVAAMDANAAILSGLAFCASGPPMIIGSLWRYAKRRQEAIQDAKEMRGSGGNSDESEAVAEQRAECS
ncbi:MAG: hypothetical protein PVF45_15140 [Anaerolineae bacterium]|jgi:hypothetical protein